MAGAAALAITACRVFMAGVSGMGLMDGVVNSGRDRLVKTVGAVLAAWEGLSAAGIGCPFDAEAGIFSGEGVGEDWPLAFVQGHANALGRAGAW